MTTAQRSYIRDLNSGSVINSNINALAKYRAVRDQKNKTKHRLSEIEFTLKTIVDDINNIQSTIKEIVSSRA